MSVEQAKKAYFEAKQNVEELLVRQRELIKKLDDTRENLPRLERACEEVRIERERVSDRYVLGECS